MITKRIYLIGLSTELANMLEYDDEVMDNHHTLKNISRFLAIMVFFGNDLSLQHKQRLCHYL